jgi:CRP-like cAMP-binding protein
VGNGSVELEAIGKPMFLARNGRLFVEGEVADCIYRVTTGVLRICKLFPDGRRQVDTFAMEGDFLGIEASQRRGFTAEAVTPVTVVAFPRKDLERLIDNSPGVARRLLGIALAQLSDTHDRLMLLGRKTAEERLSSFLLEMLERTGNGKAIRLSMSRADIADYLGLTIETVSRTFSAMKQDGILALPSAQQVVIQDRGSLEMMSGED